MPKKKVIEAVEETAQETIPVEKAPAQMPRRQGSEDLLELNDLERGVTREDSEEAKWGYLAGAVRRQQILTGIVSAGMTYTENGMPIVPIDFEGLCVKIPVREMTLIEWPEDEPIPRSVRVQIGRMLGATIDFIPAGVDFKERVAIGSRKAAMLQRQKRYYASGRVKPGILIRVEMESDGRAEIYMSDGTMFRCDHFDASQLYGTNEKKEGATSLHLQEELRYDQSHSMST